MAKTIVGLYDNYADAQIAVQDLLNEGFDRKYISLVANDVVRHPSVVLDESTQPLDTEVAQGAGAGALAGGIAGLIIGLAALTVPGIGPILIVGPLAGLLIGAGIGLVIGGLLGALVEAGVPRQQAEFYSEAVRRGGTLVTIQTADTDASRAMDIMDNHNAIDVEMRAAYWRQSGWMAYDPKAQPYTAEEIAEDRARYNAANPMPFLPPAESLSNTMPTYQAGVPVPPVSVSLSDDTDVDNRSMADVPPANAPNPAMGRRPVAIYPYPGHSPDEIERQAPPMPMDAMPNTERELVGAKGGEADSRVGGQPDDYQNSSLGGDVDPLDALNENP